MKLKHIRKLPPAGAPVIAIMVKPGFCQASGSSPPTIDQVADRIFYYVFVNFRPLTEKQIQKAIRVRKALIVEALRKLVRRNLLKRIGLGRRKQPYLYFVCSCESCLSFGELRKGAMS